jgi:hypothetical protein
MRFIRGHGEPLDGVLAYVSHDHAFRFDTGEPQKLIERIGTKGSASLAIGTLEIEVGVETGLVLFVWGYHPKVTWRLEPIEVPSTSPGLVRVVDVALQKGVAIRVIRDGEWTTSFDEATGWIRIASVEAPSPRATLVASDIALGFRGDELAGVWLRPIFE